MGRLVVVKATQQPLEWQEHATPGTLTANIQKNPQYGFTVDQTEEQEATRTQFEELRKTWEANPANPTSGLLKKKKAKRDLEGTDGGFSRVAEDLIVTLITKGVIALSDLPVSAQERITKRQTLRSQL